MNKRRKLNQLMHNTNARAWERKWFLILFFVSLLCTCYFKDVIHISSLLTWQTEDICHTQFGLSTLIAVGWHLIYGLSSVSRKSKTTRVIAQFPQIPLLRKRASTSMYLSARKVNACLITQQNSTPSTRTKTKTKKPKHFQLALPRTRRNCGTSYSLIS